MTRKSLALSLRLFILLSAMLSACSTILAPGEGNQPTNLQTTTTLTPFLPPNATDTPREFGDPTPGAEPSEQPITPPPTETAIITETSPPAATAIPGNAVWLAPYLPPGLGEAVVLPEGYRFADTPADSHVQLLVGDHDPVSSWVYALVAPYPTVVDQLTARDIKQSWRGNPSGPFAGQPLLMDESTLGVFSAWWGEPAAGTTQILPAAELVDHAWNNRPAWGIVPFDHLDPGWKVLLVDGQSPYRRDFNLTNYALKVPFSIQGEAAQIEELLANSSLPPTNRDPERLTMVALTGVTALVRATAFTMHRNGITYPARDIGEVLRSADLTHVSNEIPFTPDCPLPNPVQESLRFCSHPDYIALLEEIGTDIVELTGDHFGDWGPDAMLYTLNMYEQRDWIYYGGGYDLKDARQARLIEHNGNRIALIGCNAKGGGYATASTNNPGAVACDFNWMQNEIARLTEDGYQVITTFQHFEYYTYRPQPNQVRDSQSLAQAGASIVSGSQAHQPQGMEFFKNAFIHYGLGNLFFDQYHFCTDNACDDGFIDWHVFYDGEYLGNDLITIVFEDYARPRLMTQEERAALLNKVFSASNW
jgi:poly-gamma-glutamate synthesis protein (capsule biosynthesis protein)